MATGGKTWSRARAECPRPEHAGSRVRFDGHYGKPGHRRQLYRCLPGNADPPHRFTEVLPREEAWHDACEACERPVHLHEGPHWLKGAGRVAEDQFRRRGLRSLRPVDMPLPTSPMDGLIGPIRDALRPRCYGLKNRARTNRLLLLMQLHANRHDDPLAYAKDIRAWLEATTAAHASPAAPSPIAPASPRCADPPSQNAPRDATGGSSETA